MVKVLPYLIIIVLVCGCIGVDTKEAGKADKTTTTLALTMTTVDETLLTVPPTTASTTIATSSTVPPTTASTTTTTTIPPTTTIAGAQGSGCLTYKDCQEKLLCKDSVCTAPPAYMKYFMKIELQRMKAGLPPGPNNIPVVSNTFKVGDGMNVDLTSKLGVSGIVYTDVNNAVTGEHMMPSLKYKITGSRSWGFEVPYVVGKYELNVYFNNELIHKIPFEVME